MKDMPVAKVRNFALLGHTGSGKTTLLDALLFKLGATDRKGSPEQGTSFADWTEEEKERKLTIWAKPFEMVYSSPTLGRHELTVLDTPGYADYYGQVIAATTVADAGVLLVDATAGIQVGTQRAWRRLEALNLPRAIVISGVDRDNAHFDATLAAIQSAWGPRCRPVTAPAGEGLTRLLAPNPPAEVAEQRNALIEAAAARPAPHGRPGLTSGAFPGKIRTKIPGRGPPPGWPQWRPPPP